MSKVHPNIEKTENERHRKIIKEGFVGAFCPQCDASINMMKIMRVECVKDKCPCRPTKDTLK